MKNKLIFNKLFLISNIIFLIFSISIKIGYAKTHIEGVSIKIALDEHHYITLDFEKETYKEKYLKNTVVNLVNDFFDAGAISSEYYSEKMSFKKIGDSQYRIYEYYSVFNDRFNHVIWTYKDNRIFKHEVYDLSKKLLYSYTFNLLRSNEFVKRSKRVCSGCYFYKGFKLIYKGKNVEGENQLLFTDGLNSFSVFWKKGEREVQTVRRIVLGNYMLREYLNGYIFTVVGTIPYFEMENIIKYLIKKEVIK
ncbi:hypothetical protein FHQ18_01885 [Deferribacter autotrophicus]|uniref:MucB/RseB C-terminal domain-containing protein n=1 Tax=Deferribacter autotrophicus TaxID=500465 RepID=A0A5A8F8T4_9BACT|nr:hypothetical protein [Deferribacter autotrophicus]KAA0259226.1 hypothetical protein FHQ18_01885 [Deferribacter autotrophicus]